jgi:carbon-monoxide dehydrogenase medium subunit
LPFEYREASSVEAALTLLAEHGVSARVIAGGTEMSHILRSGREQPTLVVGIGRVPELRSIGDSNGAIDLGAAATLSEIASSLRVGALAPALAEAALAYRSPQIRNLATLGGVLCSSARRCEPAVALLALGASVELRSARATRLIAIERFLRPDGSRDLEVGELVARVLIPTHVELSTAYSAVRRLGSVDAPLASAAVSLEFDSAGRISGGRVAVGAALPPQLVPDAMRALVGVAASDVTPSKLAAACDALSVLADPRASAAYLRRMCAVAIARATASAAAARTTGGVR